MIANKLFIVEKVLDESSLLIKEDLTAVNVINLNRDVEYDFYVKK